MEKICWQEPVYFKIKACAYTLAYMPEKKIKNLFKTDGKSV